MSGGCKRKVCTPFFCAHWKVSRSVVGNWKVTYLYIFRSFGVFNFHPSVGRGRARLHAIEANRDFVLRMCLRDNAKQNRDSAKAVQFPREHLGNCDDFPFPALIFQSITVGHGGSDELHGSISRFLEVARFPVSTFFTKLRFYDYLIINPRNVGSVSDFIRIFAAL